MINNIRKIVLPVVLAVLCIAMFSSCARKERLYIYNWTYYTPPSVIEQFEAEYNVRVVYDEFVSNEDMFAKIMATSKGRLFGRQYDIVFPSKDFVPVMINHDLLERIDSSKLSNIGNIDPYLLERAGYDPNMEYSVPYYYGAAGIMVNTARVPEFERSWNIFAREDLSGRMTMLDDLREVFGGALLTLGYSVNTVDPAEVEDATNLIINSWRPNLVRFDAEAFAKGYANGEFWVVHAHPESVYEEIVDNEQLMNDTVFFIPQEGGPSYIDSMVLLKGARNIELAHKFIDFIHRPEIYAEFVDTFGLPATVNIPAREKKKGHAWYSAEDLYNTELVTDVGESIVHYNNAWFNSIRVGR